MPVVDIDFAATVDLDKLGAYFRIPRTQGNPGGFGDCIVSFPGEDPSRWADLVGDSGGRKRSFACVWTGNKHSPIEEWFKPWKENVRKATSLGKDLLVYTKKDNTFGFGQSMELEWLRDEAYSFKVVPFAGDEGSPRAPGLHEICSICGKALPQSSHEGGLDDSPVRRRCDYDLCPTCLSLVELADINVNAAPLTSRQPLTSADFEWLTSKKLEPPSRKPARRNSTGGVSERRPSMTSQMSGISTRASLERRPSITSASLERRQAFYTLQMSRSNMSSLDSKSQDLRPPAARRWCNRSHRLRYAEAQCSGTCNVCSSAILVGDCIGQCQSCKPEWWSCLECAQNHKEKAVDKTEKDLRKIVESGNGIKEQQEALPQEESQKPPSQLARRQSKLGEKLSKTGAEMLGFSQLNQLEQLKAAASPMKWRR